MKKLVILLVLFSAFTWQSYAQDARKYTTYIVKEGETLRKIARKVGCRVREIKNLNPDVPKRPSTNTTLVVPNKDFDKKGKKKADNKEAKKSPRPKKVIVHKVKQGDTFYGIAKKYNVTIQSIKDANPQLVDGLKPDQKIRIPFKEEFTVQHEKYKGVFYKVKQGETKFGIAAKFNITIEELERINPNHEGSLKVGENIVVPALKDEIEASTEGLAEQTLDSLVIYHKVLQGEGLFRIAVMYGTTQEELIALNPEATKMLRPGMLLKIPGKKKDKFLVHTVVKGDTFYSLSKSYEVEVDQLKELNPELEDSLPLGMELKIKKVALITAIPENRLGYLSDSIANYEPVHLSFLMPLMLNEMGTTLSKSDEQLQNISADFYMGAEMAIDSLKKQGLFITQHAYDTKNNAMALYEISKEDSFRESDIVIGPFFFDKTQILAEQIPNIPLFTPIFFKKQRTDSHVSIVKAAPDKGKMIEKLANYLAANYNKQKIIIISDNKESNKAKAIKLGDLLKSGKEMLNLSYIYPSHNKKDDTKIYMEKKALEESIPEKKDAWVILISDDVVINSDVVNTYGVIAKRQGVRLFTHKSFKDFDYLDFNHLCSLNWSFPTEHFDDFDTVERKDFTTKFELINHTYPNSYALMGFDLTYDTIMRLAVSGSIESGLAAGISNRLAHSFNYQKSSYGDYRNEGIMMVAFTSDMRFELVE